MKISRLSTINHSNWECLHLLESKIAYTKYRGPKVQVRLVSLKSPKVSSLINATYQNLIAPIESFVVIVGCLCRH